MQNVINIGKGNNKRYQNNNGKQKIEYKKPK